MPRYMLDTDTSSYIMKRSDDVYTSDSMSCISVITNLNSCSESRCPRRQQDQAALAAFLD